MVKPGDQAPDFTAVNDRGETVRLADFRGRKVVLYFYPKDDTPGCTREACSFRDDYSQLQQAGAVVLGVSPDPVESHVKFRDKYGLPFPLLSDPDHQVAEAYGVWKEKRMYGRTYWGIERTTFVIGEDGRVLAVIRGVKPEEHPRRALKALGVA
ncbi:Peroxiredoxin [Thermaerobacter marianensis DSM 12885]|uniref:thioredoxin-dependent peroxiredoxin n=1 Tax=Thermaerobacter marianensis (strain ATCC 700841 / DSM 12885 / JCM 10246 / 7p75a) TaxID=644966 RepID=E6SMK2_THEM7|nr:thioredoxin-dependent thiol peroxidase [Thermaerobacter marianensis]ADU50462.1 Peroxiredoxin [Thermaerobacter marianensis DSM 12885]